MSQKAQSSGAAAGAGDDEPEQFNAQVLYREWARRFGAQQQYLKSVHYYEKSSEFGDANYLWTLLGLSVALKRSGQFKRAAEVAEKCMQIDPSHLIANLTRTEALFDIAEFCFSLVCAHQGARLRKQHFYHAVLLANETIEDCVGANVPADLFVKLQPWIARLNEHRQLLEERLMEEEDEFEGIDEDQSRFRIDDSSFKLQDYRARHDRLLSWLYLGPTCFDKSFLVDLLTHPALKSANGSGSVKLTDSTRACLTRLSSQQEAIRTRKPLYAIRATAEKVLTGGRRLAIWQEDELRKCLVGNLAKFMIRRVHRARVDRDYVIFFKLIERAKVKFESYPLRIFPERQKYLDALYRMSARAYLDQRNLLRHDDEAARLVVLRKLLGLRAPKLPRLEDLAWVPCYDVNSMFLRCRERLALASQELEILWLFHELCRLFLQVKRFGSARFYAKKLRDLSLESPTGANSDYALHAAHISILIELAQQNRPEAKEAALLALESAQQLKVPYLVHFYESAIEYIDTLTFGHLSDEDSIASRGEQILAIMTADMRPRMNLLLKSMDAVPARRRLSVMPGCKPKDRKGAGKVTVRPGPRIDIEKEARQLLLKMYAPSNKVLGWVDFDDY